MNHHPRRYFSLNQSLDRAAFRSTQKLAIGFLLVLFVPQSQLSGQQPEQPEKAKANTYIDEAVKARQQAKLALDSIGDRGAKVETKQYTDQTSEQIRSQIDTMSELNNAMNQVRRERGERLGKLRTEIDLLLLQIKSLKDVKASPATAKPKITQASDRTDPGTGALVESKTGDSAVPNPKVPNVAPALEDGSGTKSKPGVDQGKSAAVEQSISFAKKDPADKMRLANSLVAIQSHSTAIRILTELLADKSIDDRQRNWIHYQLARCYREKKSFPEAERHLREAANSRHKEIASATAIWWLDQVAGQKQLQDSLLQMELQLQKLGEDHDASK